MTFFLFTIAAIIAVVFAATFAKKAAKILVPIIAVVFIASGVVIPLVKAHFAKKDFREFDLEELKKQELIIQTIDFNKFLVQGTEAKKQDSLAPYTDEISVYFIKGHADISFTDIEHLKMSKDASDYEKKILRLDYVNPSKKNPFAVTVRIDENDIYLVQSFESKELSAGFIKKDLIKPEMSGSERVRAVRQDLQGEFENQLLDFKKNNAKALEKSDLYQTFLERLSEIVSGFSDWKSVEISFSEE